MTCTGCNREATMFITVIGGRLLCSTCHDKALAGAAALDDWSTKLQAERQAKTKGKAKRAN